MTDADSNKWFTISSSSQIFHPRTAHSVVYSEEKDVLLSFGGVCMHVNELVKFLELWSTYTIIVVVFFTKDILGRDKLLSDKEDGKTNLAPPLPLPCHQLTLFCMKWGLELRQSAVNWNIKV